MFDLYAKFIKHRWKKHQYRDSWDIKLIRMAHKHFSPVDFMGKKSC